MKEEAEDRSTVVWKRKGIIVQVDGDARVWSGGATKEYSEKYVYVYIRRELGEWRGRAAKV